MMKLSKGFSTASILFTLLGVVAVGGVAYVAGKSSVPKSSTSDNSNYYPSTDERQNTQQVSDTSTVQQPVNTAPSQTAAPVNDQSQQVGPIACVPTITILSPNGGEVYQAGQQVTIKWKTTPCFSMKYPKVAIDLVAGNRDQAVTPEQHIIANNTGSVVWTVPNTQLSAYNQDYSAGPYTLTNFNNQAQFKFMIEGYPNITGRIEGPLDYSDNKFTINATQHVSTVISSPYITGTHWPPTIQKSSAAYSCSPSVSEITTVAQKVINGRTYCIRSSIDGGAGHFGGDYTYTTASGTGTETATFQLQWTSCGGYGGPGDQQYDQCKADQTRVFNSLDAMVDSLM